MGIGITGITGPEGAGKSCLMTRFCCKHVDLGGKLLTFPGYVVYAKDGKTPISKEISIKEWAEMPEDLSDVLVAIDEIENYFNSHSWQNLMVEIIGSVMGQRRKRAMGIIYTLQDWSELPKLLRMKTHYLINCWDMYWSNSSLEDKVNRGELVATAWCDVKGFQNGMPGRWYRGMMFHPKDYWPRYDTNSVVAIWHRFTKIKVKRPELVVDPFGLGDETGMPVKAPIQPLRSDDWLEKELAAKLSRQPKKVLKQAKSVLK